MLYSDKNKLQINVIYVMSLTSYIKHENRNIYILRNFYFPIFLNLIPLKGKQFVLKGKVADRDHSFLRIIALFFFTVLPQSNSSFNALYLISFTLDFFESVKVLCDTKCKRNIQVSSENSLPTNSPNSPSTPTCPSSGDIILESSFLPNGRLVTNSTS